MAVARAKCKIGIKRWQILRMFSYVVIYKHKAGQQADNRILIRQS
jgi:hypothetical protein